MQNARFNILEFAQVTPAAKRGGGGQQILEGVVIRGLLRADPLRDPADGPVEGYSDYVIRLASDATADWDAGTTYALGDAVIGADNRKYISTADDNVGNNPAAGTYWSLDPEIAPAPYDMPTQADLRPFLKWYEVDEHVPMIKVDDAYYILQQLIYVGDVHPSLMWIDDDDCAHAVFA